MYILKIHSLVSCFFISTIVVLRQTFSRCSPSVGVFILEERDSQTKIIQSHHFSRHLILQTTTLRTTLHISDTTRYQSNTFLLLQIVAACVIAIVGATGSVCA